MGVGVSVRVGVSVEVGVRVMVGVSVGVAVGGGRLGVAVSGARETVVAGAGGVELPLQPAARIVRSTIHQI
jgi:hypothetical protein